MDRDIEKEETVERDSCSGQQKETVACRRCCCFFIGGGVLGQGALLSDWTEVETCFAGEVE